MNYKVDGNLKDEVLGLGDCFLSPGVLSIDNKFIPRRARNLV